MEDLSPFPGHELLGSDDPAQWAARFVMLAALDPGFAVDEQMVTWWFMCAALAAKKAALGETDARLTRLKHDLLLNRVALIVFDVSLAFLVISFILEAAGVVR